MSWLPLLVGAAGIVSMKAALERGDIDEASRQGMVAGPIVVETALASPDRAIRLAAIAAAPVVEDRAELLVALATVAAQPDRRTALPAARAAAAIAREVAANERPDDLAAEDVTEWRDRWATISLDRGRPISVRVLAIDVAADLDRSLEHAGIGVAFDAALADPDPAFRRAALALVPVPAPAAMRAPLANVVVKDLEPLVALAAAQALCADLVADPPAPILAALGDAGLARLRTIVTTAGASSAMLRDAARCLAADKSPASAAALRKIRNRIR